MGLTINDPTTTSSSNPVLLGLGVDLTLYCPALALPEALKVAVGINPVVTELPLCPPALRVKELEPLVIRVIGVGLVVPLPTYDMVEPSEARNFAVKLYVGVEL
jgi:hypothetical protein